MDKNISSQPEAAKFRSIAAIILVLICIAAFFTYTEHLSEKAKVIARDHVITDIRYSLAMMLYDYTINGKQYDLMKFDGDNPFVLLAIYRSLPNNYRGVITELTTNQTDGWYFLKKKGQGVYLNDALIQIRLIMEYQKKSDDSAGRLVLKVLD